MNYQIPFSRFGGGGPSGPNIGKQVLMIFGLWAAAKICIKPPRGGDGSSQGSLNLTKYKNPKFVAH